VKLGVLLRPAVVLVAGALVLAAGVACGGSNTGANSVSTPQVQATTGGPSGTPRSAADVKAAAEIVQQNKALVPVQVSVKVGDTVLIKNSDSAIHTGTINGKNITGNMQKGDSVAWTALAAGEFKVTCDYHPQMKASIVVTAS
jgi:plastocyanin